MIPVYICDDEPAILQFLAKKLEDIILIQAYDMEVKLVHRDPEAILKAASDDKRRGIYFLDVDLKHKKYNGFTLAGELRKYDPRGFIIFVTTHSELALETFRYRLEALDYIIKDDTEALPQRLKQCLASVEERLQQEKNRQITDQLTIKVFDQIHHIPIEQIRYIETSHQKHRLVLHADHMVLEFFENLQNIQDQMGERFWRVHRSCLVNRSRVRKVLLKDNLVEMDSGETLPLSRTAKKEIKTSGAQV